MGISVESVQPLVRPGERVLSFDVTPPGATVVAVDDGRRSLVRFESGAEVVLRGNPGLLTIAAIDASAAVVAAPRTSPGQTNAWVVAEAGIETGFFAGDAIQDLLVLPNGSIVCTYFDEGSAKPLSGEGVAVFGREGSFVRGYRSSSGTTVMDCYAAVAVGSGSVAFWPYPDWVLTIWDTESGTQSTHQVPGRVRGAHAISHAGDRWWFFSPYNEPHRIYEWRIGSSKVTEVGVSRGPLRALPGGRFLDEGENGPAVVTVT
jgi:hypothetical protein